MILHIVVEARTYIESEGWNAPPDEDACWTVLLLDADGDFLTCGQGRTACAAAAAAWIWAWHPCGDEAWSGGMPKFKAANYQFHFYPPGTSPEIPY
jgi:hypothetical protein